MKHFLILILALVFAAQGVACVQEGDILIYKGDTTSIFYGYPLEKHPDIKSLRGKMFNGECIFLSSCSREYVAEWTIVNDQLYLTEIYGCSDIKADLASLFGEKYVDGKVKADWFTGSFGSSQGDFIATMGFDVVYEREADFYFENGELKNTQLYDNSKTKESKYSDCETFEKYIYSNINWEIIPKRDSFVIIAVKLSANENGIIDEVEIEKGYNERYDQEVNKEIIRVVRTIPEWNVYFRRGNFKRMPYTMPIFFSEENRLRYKK